MLGPYSSGMTKAIAPVSEKFGMAVIEAEEFKIFVRLKVIGIFSLSFFQWIEV